MIGSILSSVGGSLGKYFGGGILSTIGRYTGRLAGNYLEKKWFKRDKTTHRFTNAHDSFYISMAKYGKSIPLTFGRVQTPGQITWADQIIEKRNTSSVKKYLKGPNIDLTKKTTELEYFLSFAMSICLGKIEDIERVWIGDDIIDISKYKFKLYKGCEDQLPDPTIKRKTGELTPAYRGLAYIVFEELPLAEFGDTIPNFTFEVLRKANVKAKTSVEDMVESIVMIPGSGEFVYDTKIQTKSRLSEHGKKVNSKKINSHNHYNLPNSIYSLNQLKSTCSNVKWVSPVVCWFGNSLNIKDCLIKPAVEFKDKKSHYSEKWKVSSYTRTSAHEITKDEYGNPQYGGSINDASIIRYLIELKKRQLNIMFYPMFQMDIPGKPWRGKVTGNPNDVAKFFNKKGGYNEFIIHYANLVKDHVDAFVIGSELIGLTKINHKNHFPAVKELIALAGIVKIIVGPSIKVTYAADWSEYHHTDGGWYNLDPLWSSKNIDFIGIDAYFPITESLSSDISQEEIQKGFSSGEGYNYYIDPLDDSKKPIDPAYAWKNLKYWWENPHKNPDKEVTKWEPRSKPIWFTEFGFPSIDKATNQPNVFFDDNCVDGGVPKHSNGETNFGIQRTAIKAFIEFWKTQEYIGEMFLWCWDARPYPAWPVANIWSDGCLWEKGHWVNYKFGSSNLASILLEISDRCNLDIKTIDVSSVDEKIEGLIFSNNPTGLDAINTLRAGYFFDINAHYKNVISFKKRGSDKNAASINNIVMKLNDNSFTEITRTSDTEKINRLGIYYINNNDNYNPHYVRFNKELDSSSRDISLSLPIVLTSYEAQIIGSSILQNAYNENEIVHLRIFDPKITVKPSDFIEFDDIFKKYTIRVIDISMSNDTSIVTGIVDKQSNYSNHGHVRYLFDSSESYLDNDLVLLDLPMNIEGSSGSYISIYFRGKNKTSLYSKLPKKLDKKWNHISNIEPTDAICEIISFKQADLANFFVIDTSSKLIVTGQRLEQYISKDWQYAQAGKEIIKFKNIKKLKNGLYEISGLVRGLCGTEKLIEDERDGEIFILLERNPTIIRVSENLKKQQIAFKADNIEKTIDFQDRSQEKLKPYIVSSKINEDTLHIKWIDRTNSKEIWTLESVVPDKTYKITLVSENESYKYTADTNEIKIDTSELELSVNFKINIIAE